MGSANSSENLSKKSLVNASIKVFSEDIGSRNIGNVAIHAVPNEITPLVNGMFPMISLIQSNEPSCIPLSMSSDGISKLMASNGFCYIKILSVLGMKGSKIYHRMAREGLIQKNINYHHFKNILNSNEVSIELFSLPCDSNMKGDDGNMSYCISVIDGGFNVYFKCNLNGNLIHIIEIADNIEGFELSAVDENILMGGIFNTEIEYEHWKYKLENMLEEKTTPLMSFLGMVLAILSYKWKDGKHLFNSYHIKPFVAFSIFVLGVVQSFIKSIIQDKFRTVLEKHMSELSYKNGYCYLKIFENLGESDQFKIYYHYYMDCEKDIRVPSFVKRCDQFGYVVGFYSKKDVIYLAISKGKESSYYECSVINGLCHVMKQSFDLKTEGIKRLTMIPDRIGGSLVEKSAIEKMFGAVMWSYDDPDLHLMRRLGFKRYVLESIAAIWKNKGRDIYWILNKKKKYKGIINKFENILSCIKEANPVRDEGLLKDIKENSEKSIIEVTPIYEDFIKREYKKVVETEYIERVEDRDVDWVKNIALWHEGSLWGECSSEIPEGKEELFLKFEEFMITKYDVKYIITGRGARKHKKSRKSYITDCPTDYIEGRDVVANDINEGFDIWKECYLNSLEKSYDIVESSKEVFIGTVKVRKKVGYKNNKDDLIRLKRIFIKSIAEKCSFEMVSYVVFNKYSTLLQYLDCCFDFYGGRPWGSSCLILNKCSRRKIVETLKC